MDKPTTTTTAQVNQPTQKSPTQKSYESPAIIYRAPLEATAGLCDVPSGGKADGISCSNVTS